jgi:hypothetical protein
MCLSATIGGLRLRALQRCAIDQRPDKEGVFVVSDLRQQPARVCLLSGAPHPR